MNDPVYKILLVEDDSALRFIIRDNLEVHHYDVDVAEDGEAALDLYHSRVYSLIILDVMLPRKNHPSGGASHRG